MESNDTENKTMNITRGSQHHVRLSHDSYDVTSLSPQTSDVISPIAIAVELTLVLLNVLPVAVVLVYKRRPRSRLAVDELIVALSLTEIAGVLLPAPLGLTAYFSGRWRGGEVACNFYQVTLIWLQLTSMCLVTFMCADRYVAARNCVHCKPPTHAAASLTRIRLSVIVIATLALAISILPLFELAPPALSASGQLCRSWLTSHPVDTIGHDDVRHHVFYVAYLTIGYANVTIALIVNVSLIANLCSARNVLGSLQSCPAASARNGGGGGERGEEGGHDGYGSLAVQYDCRNSIELSVTVAVVTAIVYLSWLPVLVLITVQKTATPVSEETLFYAVLCASVSGLFNPLLYASLSQSYRHGYVQCLTSITKFIFGCPLSRADVITDISSQAQRLRTSRSSSAVCSASGAGLLRDDSHQSGLRQSSFTALCPSSADNAAFSQDISSDSCPQVDVAMATNRTAIKNLLKAGKNVNGQEDDQPALIQLENDVNLMEVNSCINGNQLQVTSLCTNSINWSRHNQPTTVVKTFQRDSNASDNDTYTTSGDEDGEEEEEEEEEARYNDEDDEDEEDVSVGSYEHNHRDDFLRMQGIPCEHDISMSHINSIFD